MYGDKCVSGTSHSIIVVNVVVIPLSFCWRRSVKRFGRGAVLYVSALSLQWQQRWCAPRPPLPVFFTVQLAVSGAADGCSRRSLRPTIPRPATAVGGSHAARRYYSVGSLLGTIHLDRSWCGESLGLSLVFFVRIPFHRSFFAGPRPVWPVSARSFRNAAANCVY